MDTNDDDNNNEDDDDDHDDNGRRWIIMLMMTTVGAPGVPCEACRSSMDGVNQSSMYRWRQSIVLQ